MANIPQRLAVLQKLTTLLNGITSHPDAPANYVFDVEDHVYRGIATYSGDEEQWPLPMLSILESPRPDIGVYAGAEGSDREEKWVLLLQGWAKDDVKNPTDPAYWLMAAVEERLARVIQTKPEDGLPVYPDDYLLGRLIDDFKFGPGVVRPPTEGLSSKAFFYLPLRVGLATTAGQPYIPG